MKKQVKKVLLSMIFVLSTFFKLAFKPISPWFDSFGLPPVHVPRAKLFYQNILPILSLKRWDFFVLKSF